MPNCFQAPIVSRLFVFANDKAGQARVVGVLDNLGKGAGGAAVQNT